MFKIPKFNLFGDNNPEVEDSIQPKLELRSWDALETSEKEIAFQQILNSGWIADYSREILRTIEYLNRHFLRLLPGKKLHGIPPKNDFHRYGNEHERIIAAVDDFQQIFLHGKPESLVFRMLTKFAEAYIDGFSYQRAEEEEDDKKRQEYTEKAFKKFDRLANCINHIFEQFCVNAVLTRSGLIPRQEDKITEEVYVPTLKILADPKWQGVSKDLASMFSEFQEGRYPETITNAHRAVQRFLQILAGEEGKSGKGEVGKLFNKVIQEKLIPIDKFSEPLIKVFQGYLSSQRATKSTSKPTKEEASPSDALLVMNTVMVFLQHCLQENK